MQGADLSKTKVKRLKADEFDEPHKQTSQFSHLHGVIMAWNFTSRGMGMALAQTELMKELIDFTMA